VSERGGRVRDPSDGAEHGARGRYTVVEPPSRLAMTWVWDDDPDNTQTIELHFSEREGRTTVVLINSGIPTEHRRGTQDDGWRRCLDRLGEALSPSS
jgi:uncharacterized protein YndB with AHSA1/START domain